MINSQSRSGSLPLNGEDSFMLCNWRALIFLLLLERGRCGKWMLCWILGWYGSNNANKRQNRSYTAPTPSFKLTGSVRAGSKSHSKPQHVSDILETSAPNHTTALLMHVSNCTCGPLMIISVHTLPVTVHKLRQSVLACNQCVMLLSAWPINTRAGICPTR